MSTAEALATPRPPATEAPEAAPRDADLAWRVLKLLSIFRLLAGIVLLAVCLLLTEPRVIGEANSPLAQAALAALIGFGWLQLLLIQRRMLTAAVHTYLHFALDLVAFTTLLHASGGIASGLGGLFVVSVGGLALLVPRDRAFLLAAVTTLALLFEQSLAQLQGMTTSSEYAPAGILGAVIFVIAGVVQLLRHRIVETEALAEQRGVDLKNLVELNEYIIQHLRESIVVVDEHDHVRLINESATKHLGAGTQAAGSGLVEIAPALAVHLAAWRTSRTHERDAPAARFASVDGSTNIQPHFAPLGPDRSAGVVIFLEDTSLIAERVQQTKLAALGRLSASIAHEIRNPVGALSHAGQLLAESDNIGAEEHRLTSIISVNSKRVSQIVDSILTLSRRESTQPEHLQLRTWAREFAEEFVQTQELFENSVAVAAGPDDPEVEMDPTHLNQVLWNLCDNAVKYASEAAGAISVELSCGYVETTGRPYLEVGDRGSGVEADKAEQIFEPFYTGRPGGTGLGLYICRELCERNGATLRYSPRPGGGSLFRIVFADPNRWQLNDASA